MEGRFRTWSREPRDADGRMPDAEAASTATPTMPMMKSSGHSRAAAFRDVLIVPAVALDVDRIFDSEKFDACLTGDLC